MLVINAAGVMRGVETYAGRCPSCRHPTPGAGHRSTSGAYVCGDVCLACARSPAYEPGAIVAVTRAGYGRGFVRVVESADQPRGTKTVHVEGTDTAWQRNQAMRIAVAAVPGCAWVLMMDQDQRAHESDVGALVTRLLDWDVPVVSAVICQRARPWPLNAYVRARSPERLRLEDLPEQGLVRVDAVGAGLVLIRRAAWDAVGDPWFRNGTFSPETQGEDLDFTWRVTQAGLGVYVDAGLCVGHEVTATVWPGRRDRRPWIELPGEEAAYWAPLTERPASRSKPSRNGPPEDQGASETRVRSGGRYFPTETGSEALAEVIRR